MGALCRRCLGPRRRTHDHRLKLQCGCFRRDVHTLLAAWADQLYLNFLRGGEGLEELSQVQGFQRRRAAARELIAGVDFTVLVFAFVAGVSMFGRIAEQRAFQFLGGLNAPGSLWQAEQHR